MSDSAIAVIERPALAAWMFARGLRNADAAKVLGVGAEQVRRYCAPFGDPLRATPRPEIMRRIVGWTAGAVTPADFYPAEPSA